MGRGERVVLVVFALAALGWMLRPQLAPWSGLPFADGRFDVVLSTFGATFTPDDDRTAEPYLVELSGPQAADIQCTRRTFNFR
jgi:hypothetical protein